MTEAQRRRKALLDAVAVLQADVATLERDAAAGRALIKQLACRADGEIAKRCHVGGDMVGRLRASLSLSDSEDCTYTTKHGAKPKTAAPAKSDDKASAAELSKVVAAIAEAAAQAQVATRDKDGAKLRAAVAAGERGQRRAGELLAAMNGRVRPLPGDEPGKRRWRAAAQLSSADFEKRVRRSQRRALAAIGVAPDKPAPAKAKPATRPQQATKISDWREEPDGSRSRTVTAVDSVGAEAT
jgi:hypothetical protein